MQIQGVVLIPSQRFLLSLDMSSQDSPDISDKAKKIWKVKFNWTSEFDLHSILTTAYEMYGTCTAELWCLEPSYLEYNGYAGVILNPNHLFL